MIQRTDCPLWKIFSDSYGNTLVNQKFCKLPCTNYLINPIPPYSIACGVLAWPDRFSYCAACLDDQIHLQNTHWKQAQNANLLYKICSIVSHLISVCTVSDIKSIIIAKEPLGNDNATEIIRKLALAIDTRSDTCETILKVRGSMGVRARSVAIDSRTIEIILACVSMYSKRSIEIYVWFRYGTPMRVIHQLKEGAANFLSIPNSI